MALKITLKPHERMIFGGAVVKNGDSKCELIIENNVPILREKDILTEDNADSPCKRLYFIIQLMYVDEKNLVIHHNLYWNLVRELVSAAPSMVYFVDQLSEYILNNRYYQALKLAKKMVEYEREVLSNVLNPVGSL
jgi:flagellar biosynthesis repressor protein FlbT